MGCGPKIPAINLKRGRESDTQPTAGNDQTSIPEMVVEEGRGTFNNGGPRLNGVGGTLYGHLDGLNARFEVNLIEAGEKRRC